MRRLTPVEEMALAETMEIAGTQAGAGVEKAVFDVDGQTTRARSMAPRTAGDARYPGKSERPNECDGGRVEAGEVPKAQSAGASMTLVWLGALLGCARWGEPAH